VGHELLPGGTAKVTAPLWTAAEIPKRSVSTAMAATSSSVWIWTRSLPTLALSASGVSTTTIRPEFMMAMRSQFSASSM
jgi:hypothetical protein